MNASQPAQQPPAGDGLEARHRRWLAPLAWSGILGPILFTAAFLAQEASRSEEYGPLAETVSALEAGPNGWIQQLNFVVFGVLTIAFAVGLHRGLRPTRAGAAGPALLVVSGIGLLLAASFPLREDATGTTYDPGGHVIAGVTFFLSSAAGLIVISRRLARDPRWRGIAPYVLAAGIVALAGFVAMGVFVDSGQRRATRLGRGSRSGCSFSSCCPVPHRAPALVAADRTGPAGGAGDQDSWRNRRTVAPPVPESISIRSHSRRATIIPQPPLSASGSVPAVTSANPPP
jgi:hypothetical membrane protein